MTIITTELRLARHSKVLGKFAQSMPRLKIHFTALAMTLACAGCAVGPEFKTADAPANTGSFTRTALVPAVPADEGATQHFDTAAEVQQAWWTAFGSPALNDLVKRSFAQNPNIASALAALHQAHENAAAQYDTFFPTVQAAYSPTRQSTSGTLSSPLTNPANPYSLHTAQLSISYVPDVFGLNRRTVESLRAQEDAQRDQLAAAYLTLASNVTAAAIQEAALRAQVKATQTFIDNNTQALTILRRQAEYGFATGLDVAAQESALAQAQQAMPPLTRQLEQTRDQIAVLAGQLPAQGGADDFDVDTLDLPQDLPVGVPSQLIRNRPDVRSAEAQVHAASAAVGIALANRLPQFSLSAVYGGSAPQFGRMFSDGNSFWGLTGNVGATLFDFGALKHRQHAAEAALEQAKAQYHGVVLTAFQNVADAMYALDSDAKALTAAVNTEKAAKKTMDITKSQFDLGFVNGLALLTAQTAYQQAHLTRIQAQAARYTDTVALFQALGGSWQMAEEKK